MTTVTAPAGSNTLVPTYRGFNPASMTTAAVEWKYVDTTIASVTFGNPNPIRQLLNGLQVGSGVGQRIGRQVSIRSVEMVYDIDGEIGITTPNHCRVVLFYDKQANGAAPTWADLYETTSYTITARRLDNRKRFKILMDKHVLISGNGQLGADVIPTKFCDKKFLKFRTPLQTTFNAGSAGTIADISTNSLYLFAITDVAVPTKQAILAAYIRVRYTD